MPQCPDLRQMIKRNITKFRQITWKKNHGHEYSLYGNNNNDARAYADAYVYVSYYAKDRRFRTKVSASMHGSLGADECYPRSWRCSSDCRQECIRFYLSTVVSDAYLRRRNNNNKNNNSRKKSLMDKAMDMAKRK